MAPLHTDKMNQTHLEGNITVSHMMSNTDALRISPAIREKMTRFRKRHNTGSLYMQPSLSHIPHIDNSNSFLDTACATSDTNIPPDSNTNFISLSTTTYETIDQDPIPVGGNPIAINHGVPEIESEYDHLNRPALETILSIDDGEYSEIGQHKQDSIGREYDMSAEENGLSAVDELFNSNDYQLLDSPLTVEES